MQKVRVESTKVEGPKAKGKGRAKRSPYAKLPYDARLLVRFLEIMFPEQTRYSDNARYTSRAFKAAMRVLASGGEDGVKFSGFPGIWYIQSSSRVSLNRWYVVNIRELTCEVDTSQLVIPKGLKIHEDKFFCEDHRHHGGLCWHIFAAALAEAARIDAKEIPQDD
jgi:hypothetical protein